MSNLYLAAPAEWEIPQAGSQHGSGSVRLRPGYRAGNLCRRPGVLADRSQSRGCYLARLLALRFFNPCGDAMKLITFGTSICGGSAIAAVSSVMKSRDEDIGVAMGVVFLLNTAALFSFPLLAPLTGLTPEQYGIWCALSIHDTSSVVGAAAVLGDSSLSTATIMKLTRTLWILPSCSFSPWAGGREALRAAFHSVFIRLCAASFPFPFLFRKLG